MAAMKLVGMLPPMTMLSKATSFPVSGSGSMMHCLDVPDDFGVFKTRASSLLFVRVGEFGALSDSDAIK